LYQNFDFYIIDFPETEKGNFNDQLMVRIRKVLGEQIIEDTSYENDCIGWRKEEELRRKKIKEEKILEQGKFSSPLSSS
jgi:hypothetical protein